MRSRIIDRYKLSIEGRDVNVAVRMAGTKVWAVARPKGEDPIEIDPGTSDLARLEIAVKKELRKRLAIQWQPHLSVILHWRHSPELSLTMDGSMNSVLRSKSKCAVSMFPLTDPCGAIQTLTSSSMTSIFFAENTTHSATACGRWFQIPPKHGKVSGICFATSMNSAATFAVLSTVGT